MDNVTRAQRLRRVIVGGLCAALLASTVSACGGKKEVGPSVKGLDGLQHLLADSDLGSAKLQNRTHLQGADVETARCSVRNQKVVLVTFGNTDKDQTVLKFFSGTLCEDPVGAKLLSAVRGANWLIITVDSPSAAKIANNVGAGSEPYC